jgi:1-acyl-sn-glycerol-3-phosphate acyltransferase
MRDSIHTVATWAAALSVAPMGIASIGAQQVDPLLADKVIGLWARNMLRAAGVRVVIEGLEHLPSGTCVIAGNHQSNFDPLLVFGHLPKHVRFVAKAELFRIPIFGQAIKYTGNIKVDRSGSDRDRRVLQEAVKEVREHTSVVFYPEGTRSADGVLRSFKKGAALMAIQAQVPLLPIAVAGTKDILPPGSIFVRGGQLASMVIGEPIPTVGLVESDRDRLTETLRARVAALLERANALTQEAR